MHKDLKKVVNALIAAGFEIRTTSRGRISVYLDGQYITMLAAKPADRHGWKNGLAPLRDHGFHWPQKR